MKDLEQTIISQYANSPVLLTIIENMNESIDPSADLDSFYSMVWNVSTAEGFGLDIWGEIVGVSRLLVVPKVNDYLGFDESDSWASFGQQPLYIGQKDGAYELSDDAYRTLIFLKALANISSATAQSYNSLLQRMFAGRGRCYAADQGDMQMQLVFEFGLKDYELAIIEQSGAFLPPAGVSMSLLNIDINATFGFSEAAEGGLGKPIDAFTFPNAMPYIFGETYDLSKYWTYQPFGYGTFAKPAIQVT